MELNELSGGGHPEFSHMQLSQCKLQEVCCEERMHVTEFGKIASFFLLCELQIVPTYLILKWFPSILVWRDPWFRKIAWSFPHTSFEEYRLSSSLEAYSSWNCSISSFGILFTRVPDVVEELGKSYRYKYIVLQCMFNIILAYLKMSGSIPL